MDPMGRALLILALNGFIASALILMFRKSRILAELFTVLSSFISLVSSLYLIINVSSAVRVDLLPHITLMADKLSLFFSLVVSLIGTAVSIYSIDYMREAEDHARYYSLISLFIGAMLNLVLASDLIYLLLNWELVGVCSALLIGYWWERKEARRAGMKALVMTRIGDIGLMAFTAIAIYYGASDISSMLSSSSLISKLLPIAPLLILAAMGKSAQFPLHTWLPDAMEGPTTVSALLHAATMVKAGIYLVLRFYPLLSLSSESIIFLLAVSLVTLYISSLAGLVSNDIKRVLAFSTLSSLSLMFLAISIGQFYVAILYLFNHALFKALLFLVAGKIEHTLHTRDITKLKNLWGKGFRFETLAFLVGALSAAGLPPLAAGIVKEEIFAGMSSYFTPTLYYIIAGTLSFLLSIFIMRPFVLSFLGSSTRNEERNERTPLIFSVNLFLLFMTLLAYIPTSLLASYFEGMKMEMSIELIPFSGVLLGIICAFLIPKVAIGPEESLRRFVESSFGMDILYNRIGEIFHYNLSTLASKLNRGKASQGLLGLVVVILLFIILTLVVSP
ncbi:MAG: NADH-quinone oxidoreductase subunit L [Fervidicoccaceae archaeon]